MDEDFLDSLLGYICFDPAFCRAYSHLFDMEDFTTRALDNSAQREIVAGVVLENWRRYTEPVGEQLKAAVIAAAKRNRLPDTHRNKLVLYAKTIYSRPRTAPDSMGARFLEFKREALLGRMLDEVVERNAVQDLSIQSFGSIVEKIQVLEARLSPPARTFNDAEAMEDRFRQREQTHRTTGYWTLIDGLDDLMEISPKKGYFCMGLALAKYGKSTFLSHIGIAGCIQGARVLYLTLEDSRDIVEARHDAIISGVPLKELGKYTDRVRQANKRFWSNVRGKLKIVDGTGERWSVSDVQALYLRERDQGFDADIVIVDYFFELEPVGHYKEFRFRSDEISRDLRLFAAKRNVLLWTAHQSAINADTMKAKEMTMDKLAEDRGLARKVHLLIGMGQGEWDMSSYHKHQKCIHLYISASKFCPSGVGCNIITDYSRALFYDSEETQRRERVSLIAAADEANGTTG